MLRKCQGLSGGRFGKNRRGNPGRLSRARFALPGPHGCGPEHERPARVASVPEGRPRPFLRHGRDDRSLFQPYLLGDPADIRILSGPQVAPLVSAGRVLPGRARDRPAGMGAQLPDDFDPGDRQRCGRGDLSSGRLADCEFLRRGEKSHGHVDFRRGGESRVCLWSAVGDFFCDAIRPQGERHFHRAGDPHGRRLPFQPFLASPAPERRSSGAHLRFPSGLRSARPFTPCRFSWG